MQNFAERIATASRTCSTSIVDRAITQHAPAARRAERFRADRARARARER